MKKSYILHMKAFSDLSIIWFVDEDALIDTYIYVV